MSIPSKDSSFGFMQRNCWSVIGLIVVLLVIGLMGWQWYDEHFPSWDEEVLFSDGRMITVHRAHKFNTEHTLIETSLTFDLPEMGGKQTWRENMQPVLIESNAKDGVYVVGFPYGEKQVGQYRHPKYGYVAFKWDGQTFIRVPFLSIPESLRLEENMQWCMRDSYPKTWHFKSSGWCNDKSGQFQIGLLRNIDLEKMRKWATTAARRHNIEPLTE